jgi:hypothetical protein
VGARVVGAGGQLAAGVGHRLLGPAQRHQGKHPPDRGVLVERVQREGGIGGGQRRVPPLLLQQQPRVEAAVLGLVGVELDGPEDGALGALGVPPLLQQHEVHLVGGRVVGREAEGRGDHGLGLVELIQADQAGGEPDEQARVLRLEGQAGPELAGRVLQAALVHEHAGALVIAVCGLVHRVGEPPMVPASSGGWAIIALGDRAADAPTEPLGVACPG